MHYQFKSADKGYNGRAGDEAAFTGNFRF